MKVRFACRIVMNPGPPACLDIVTWFCATLWILWLSADPHIRNVMLSDHNHRTMTLVIASLNSLSIYFDERQKGISHYIFIMLSLLFEYVMI